MPGGGHHSQRERVDRLARAGLLVVLASAALAVAGGVLAAATWRPEDAESSYLDPCPAPPCFGGGGLPALTDVPVIAPLLGFLLAAALGLPGLLLLGQRLVGRPAAGGRVLPFAGPLLVIALMEVVPHLLNPCLVADVVAGELPPGCARGAHGVDVADRWHALHHAVVGGVPAALGYRALLRLPRR